MKTLIAMLALLLAPLPAAAYTQSQAPVTPDPSAQAPGYAELWPHVSLAEARRLTGQAGVVLVDARAYSEWEQSHIPGALPLPSGEFDKRYPQIKRQLVHASVVLLYCHGKGCGIADYVAQLLADQGHRNVAVFGGGYPEWKEAKLPLEGKAVAVKKKGASAKPKLLH